MVRVPHWHIPMRASATLLPIRCGRSTLLAPIRHPHHLHCMTWSIIARDARGRFGVAIASRFFAVGALCVHTRRGVGALSTQALMNPLYGPAGIQRLAAGASAADVVAELTGA